MTEGLRQGEGAVMTMMSQPPVTTKARLLAGKPLRDSLMAQIPQLIAELGRAPNLAVVLVGENPASLVYVAQKQKTAQGAGIECTIHRLTAVSTQDEVESLLAKLAKDEGVDGILLQLPLPAPLERQRALDVIPLEKDVDGLTTESQRRAGTEERSHLPATPLGVMRLLTHAKVNARGKKTAVIGRSHLVGAPLAQLLRAAGADVTVIGRDTPNPAEIVKTCDLVCVAAGQPGLVTPDWVKDNAVVIDVGLTRTTVDGNACLLGDVDPAVAAKTSLMTPVPGGVGPMTVASLLTNTVNAAFWRAGKPIPLWKI